MYIPSDPKIWAEIEADPFIRKPRFWLPLLGVLLIVCGTPEDIFQKLPLLELFARFISDIVPSIDKWSDRSSSPPITRLLFVYFWSVMPYYIFIFSNNISYEHQTLNKWLSQGSRRHASPVIIMVMTLVIAYIFYYFALPEELSCRRLCIHESITLQSIYGFCMVVSIAGLFACMFWWLKNFKTIHFTQPRKGAGE